MNQFVCKRKLQRHRYNKMDSKTNSHLGFDLIKSCERTNFPLQLWSSSSRTSFIDALENLALQSKPTFKNFFFDIEATIKNKLGSILEKLTQRHNRKEQADLDDCDDETCTSTQIFQIQKKQLIDMQEHLERYCNVLPVFGFNSAKYDLNLIKSNLLPILVNERNIEPTVIEKAKQFISFKYGNIQLLNFMNFLGGATSLVSFLKAYKTSEINEFFPTNGLITRQTAESRTSPVSCFLQ